MRNQAAIQKVSLGDRITFDSDEGIKTGFVADVRKDLGNGQAHAWIELDHQWAGMFQAVPLTSILTNDGFGRAAIIQEERK